MFGNLVQTKLFIPPLRPSLVQRPRLLGRLDQGLEPGHKITLVSTPPGFGKTTLLCQWIDRLQQPVGWLSLDEEDNDPDRFLAYLLAATRKIAPEVVNALPLADAAPQQPLTAALAELIDELAGCSEQIILILDDFHLINESQILESLFSTVQHLPPNLHLVLSSRSDPPWPLARLRGRRELVELRTGDLRFTSEEAAEFLNEIMALELPAAGIAALEDRTEGWITGLQLASLSLANREDAAGFINTFSGSNRFILDYLLEEVLDRQPPDDQTFLLKSAILARMNAPLCDAVMESTGSQEVLDRLESGNLFLVHLDDERHWFRYHHLFKDLLYNRLGKIYPDRVKDLHRRASVWFEEAELPEEAVPHALDGEDFDRAARIMERLAADIIRQNRERGFSRWLDRLPQEKIRQWPWLSISRARTSKAAVEESLQWAEGALALVASGKEESTGAQYSPAEKEKLAAFIAISWAHKALIDGDIAKAQVEAEKALALLPAEDSQNARLSVALGGIYWAKGDRKAAEKSYAEAAAAGMKTGNWQFVTTSLCYLGLQQMKLGRLHAAQAYYREGLATAKRSDGTQMPIATFPLIRLGDLLREWNELEVAEEYLAQGFELAFDAGYHDVILDAHINMARLYLARNQRVKAVQMISEAERLIERAPPDAFLIGWADECRMRVWLSDGELDAAIHWMEKRGLTVDGELSFRHDLHHINLARVLIALGVHEPSRPYLREAQKLLGRLESAAEKADWVHETIKIQILQALALRVSGQQRESAEVLAKALTLAEPGGYIRLFIDEGRSMGEILQLADQIRPSSYAARLLAQMDGEVKTAANAVLPDPLSDRELEVLRLLDSQLSGTKIAERLYISANTVHFHIKNIYEKLGVHSRAEAIDVARSLNLL